MSLPAAQIIVTHDQEEAFDLADQVVIFNRGLIEQSGSPNEIIKRPATPFVMGFVGDTNSVPAGCMLVRRSGFNPRLGKARVMFRPSDIRLSKEYVATLDGQQVRGCGVVAAACGCGVASCSMLQTQSRGGCLYCLIIDKRLH